MPDDDLFRDMLGEDVAPLKAEKRVVLNTKSVDAETLAARREAAQLAAARPLDPLAGDPVEKVDPLAILSFQRAGVQHGVFRKLRLGKYSLDAHLDLHKMVVDQARREVYQFVQDCVANDVRSALLTHGTGAGRDQPAVLKSCIAFWLPQMDAVLAFHTALKQHGGYGATYMLLRKSDRKKDENFEKHSKR